MLRRSDSLDPWTAAHLIPLSVEFSRQEYWSGLPFPNRGDLLNPGIEPASPALATRFFTIEIHGKLQERKTSGLIISCSLLRNAASPVPLMNRGKYYTGECGQQFWGGKWFRRQCLNVQQGWEKLNQLILPTFPMYAEAWYIIFLKCSETVIWTC